MARIHGGEPFVGCDIALETTWGTIQTTGFNRLYPLIEPGETGALIRPPISPPKILGTSGVRTDFDYGRSFVQGEFTIRPTYNQSIFWLTLLGELHGMTGVGSGNRGVNGTAPGGTPTGFTSFYFIQALYNDPSNSYTANGTPKGITLRVFKSGTSNAGTCDQFSGVLITGARWDQPQAGPPTLTFRWIGKAVAPTAASGLTLASAPSDTAVATAALVNAGTGYAANNILTVSGGTAGRAATIKVLTVSSGAIATFVLSDPGTYSVQPSNPVSVTGGGGSGATFTLTWKTALQLTKFRDLKNGTKLSHAVHPAIFKSNTSYSNDMNVRSFNFDIQSNIELDRSFINNPDALDKPAHTDKWRCTGQLVLSTEQDYGLGTKPHGEYLAGTLSALRIRYVSDAMAYDGGTSDANQLPWAWDFWFPNVLWTDSRPNLSESGNPPHPVEFEAYKGTFTGSQYCDSATRTGQWMIQVTA